MMKIEINHLFNEKSTVLFSVVLSCFVFKFTQAQISYPQSVSSYRFSPITIDPNQIVPSNNQTIKYSQPPVTPMGSTAQDIINQQYRNTMLNMGYNPPFIPSSDPTIRHQQILRDAQAVNQSKQQQQIHEIQKLLSREDLPKLSTEEMQRMEQTKFYRKAFAELISMNNDTVPLSVKRAVYLVENAFLDNTLDYKEYSKLIEKEVKTLRMLMKREKISESNNLGKNYLIQKLLSEKIYENNVLIHKPFQYDFEDFLGEVDWRKMFVSKLLKSGKGQCHSLPLLYLILAEELNANAWLSLAPEHSFIIFNQGNTFFNYEATNGNPVTEEWLMESGYISTLAIKNRIYLDTLGKDGLMSTLLADLTMGYVRKFGYDEFMSSMVDSIIKIYPRSIQGQMFKADLLTLETKSKLRKAGNPPVEIISNFPEAHQSYLALFAQYDLIDRLGYVQMPKEKYAIWLNSLNDQKNYQKTQNLKTQIVNGVQKSN